MARASLLLRFDFSRNKTDGSFVGLYLYVIWYRPISLATIQQGHYSNSSRFSLIPSCSIKHTNGRSQEEDREKHGVLS